MKMKVLLIGAGGREHSIALKLKESKNLSKLFIAPGNAGTAMIGENISLQVTDINALKDFALEQKIDLTVVGPEAPLVAGIVDKFEEAQLKIVGPNQAAAQLEGSKSWAKSIMRKYHLPTAEYEVFNNYDQASAYLKDKNVYPIVIKADGLAAGKGVTIVQSLKEAEAALKDCLVKQVFGKAGGQVVIEEYLHGEEASIFAFTDGKTVLPMVPAQDHKAIFDGDKGPNTGGMGAYSPAPVATKLVEQKVREKILIPLVEGLKQEGIVYQGIIYAGLMINNEEPKIVEFNVRFGDPETQVVLPRLKTDLLEILLAIAENRLAEIDLEWTDQASVCVVLAAKGYPGAYEKNKVISGLKVNNEQCQIIHAGTKTVDDKVLSNGGRVLGIVAKDENLKRAIDLAYEVVDQVEFEDKYYRKDIGQKALMQEKVL
jgi:phosphoribosylamine--glycine ligase